MLERGGKVGDYTLVRFLGRGQFGVVWLAEKEIQFSKRKFRHALKFLPRTGDEKNLKLIQAEIDTWIEASGHPNVMSVLDMMVDGDHIIIASEFADGGSLLEWLSRCGGKAPSHEKALEMMTGILSGIEHLHSRNVVHRDLKPENILLQGNCPRITDFGISRIASGGSMSAIAMGSPTYMSPESFDGGKSRQTDIWSAGVILYEMLAGEHPYSSDTIYGLVSSIREEEPKLLPVSIPYELRQIVETALQKDLTRRFRTAQDMRSVVEQEIYNLKIRFQQQVADGVVDPGAITLFDEKLDLSELNEETPLIKETSVASQPSEENGTDTWEVDPAKSAESLELDTLRSMPAAPAIVVPAGTSTHYDLKTQIAQWKRPVLLAGGIGSVVIVVIVVGLISFVMAARSIIRGISGTKGGTIANTMRADPIPVNANPKPPDGMVYVPGGEFMMGRDNGIPEESPAHKVAVGPFFIDIYEVTNEQYAEFVKQTNRRRSPRGWMKNTYAEGEAKYPVVGVTWKDAGEFATWAGKRLPTEEEWEFAARGTDGRLYPWGKEWIPNIANADGASATFAEVGSYKGSSPFGVFDMVGNAGEWTASDFKAYPEGTLPALYAGKRKLKTIRGSSFDLARDYSTATYRFGYRATGGTSYEFTGFRCARDVNK